ncbi:TetR/AcrR family transcriptional regulator C-terminal domain-containing protein [Xylophilus sp.]|uniref:TetR/AcrR family transcriptional regulator C-terminal domain-containing protein n=1 Tax=Xylophilus sp. TaxID=2653893 RepID=UPI0013BB1C81|nr:TetR/AcrR family transcriptional regulator C-terminal domain-containing protein [Xylophilus sp.]KAF1046818.1 MAG: Tetracycline repressor protein class A [Xylophilus sp.]
MTKLDRDVIVAEALALLDEVGLDAVSTRLLARRLGVEQPSLYWHFRRKAELLTAMAKAAMAPHAAAPLPGPADDWREWFRGNWGSFRSALLMHRDGARLHAGTNPQGEDLSRALHKMEFLIAAGLPERAVKTAMLTAGHFTVGSVLEQQSAGGAGDGIDGLGMGHDEAFDAGLRLIIEGLGRAALG